MKLHVENDFRAEFSVRSGAAALWMKSTSSPASGVLQRRPVTLWNSSVLRDEARDQPVERRVLLALGRDLPDGVEGRRVVLVREEASDLGQREVRRLLQDVHRHLAGKDDVSPLRLRAELGRLQPV